MTIFNSKKLIMLGLILVLALTFTGCNETKQAKDKPTVKLGYVQWASAEASTHIVEEVLERAGYKVETPLIQFAAMYQGTANNELDAFVCAWLPNTDEEYWEKYGDQLVDLGANYNSAKIGIVVPEYVEVNSLANLHKYADKFNKRIVGIDPGATEMQIVRNTTIPKYGLEDWKLKASSGPAMATALGKAIRDKRWIAVTGWKPHWKWAKWDLKFLEDPKLTMGKGEYIKSIGRQGIKEDMPKVAGFLSNYQLTTSQLGDVMLQIQGDVKPEKAAKKFVNNHPQLVNEWYPGDKKIVK